MRVALLSRAAYPLHAEGGLERAVYHLAKHLKARGVEGVLLTRPPLHDAAFPFPVITVPYARFEWGRHGSVLDRTLHYPGFAARLGQRVAALVRERRVDVVHAQGIAALGYARLRATDPSLRAPIVMNPQGMEEHRTQGLKRMALGRLRRLSREAAGSADRVIATDGSTLTEVTRLLGVSPRKTVVVPNAVDLTEIQEQTPDDPRHAVHAWHPALATADPLLLSVGRLERYKGFEDVLQSLLLLRARGGLAPCWAWVLVGEGPRRSVLERHAQGELAAHIHVLGRVSDRLLHALYARADLFVHATHYEGSSLVTLEAMAHACAVVAARAGGIPDKVVDGETGLLVAPGDVAGLAAAIQAMVADPARRRAFGEQGRERVRAMFSWSQVVDQTIALYEELRRSG